MFLRVTINEAQDTYLRGIALCWPSPERAKGSDKYRLQLIFYGIRAVTRMVKIEACGFTWRTCC